MSAVIGTVILVVVCIAVAAISARDTTVTRQRSKCSDIDSRRDA